MRPKKGQSPKSQALPTRSTLGVGKGMTCWINPFVCVCVFVLTVGVRASLHVFLRCPVKDIPSTSRRYDLLDPPFRYIYIFRQLRGVRPVYVHLPAVCSKTGYPRWYQGIHKKLHFCDLTLRIEPWSFLWKANPQTNFTNI